MTNQQPEAAEVDMTEPVEVDPTQDRERVEADQLDPSGQPDLAANAEEGLDEEIDEFDDQSETAVSAPALLLLAANASAVTGSSAFHAAGVAGLAGTAAAVGTTAAVGAVMRRAHLAEARRRAEAEAEKNAKNSKKTNPTAAKTGAESRRPGARPTGRPAGGVGGARPFGTGRGAGRGAGLGTGRGGAGAGRKGLFGRKPGAGRGTGRGTGRGAGPMGFAAAPPVAAGSRAKGRGAGRGAGAGGGLLGSLGRSGGRSGGRVAGAGLFGGRSGGAAGRAAGRGAAGGRAGGVGGRVAGAGRGPGAGAKHRGTGAGLARLGRATHAASGSKPVRKAIAAGQGARRALGSGLGTGRGAASSARKARAAGAGPRGVARAVRQHLKASQAAARRRQAHQESRMGQFMRRNGRRAGAASAASLAWLGVGLWVGTRYAGRWGAWFSRAGWARFRRMSAPASPSSWDRSAAGRRARSAAEQDRYLAGLDEDQEIRIRVQVMENHPVGGHGPVLAKITSLPPARARRAVGAGGGTGPYPPSNPNNPSGPRPAGLITQRGTHPMSAGLGSSLNELSEQMVSTAGTYEAEGMVQWGTDLAQLEQVLENVASAIRTLRTTAGEDPINPEVLEAVEEIAELQSACAAAASEIHATFQASHAEDLRRHTDPRPNEQKWDVNNNQ